MSGVSLLPDDLLSEVLLLIDDKSVTQTFAVAQVSRRWRSIALDCPLLWSSVRLETKKDWSCLPLILERTGYTSMLDVELFANSIDATPYELHLAALVPYAPRLRKLVARPTLSQQGLAPLFGGQVDFPALDTLRVHGPGMHLDVGVASAPALRVLDLSQVFPVNLETLLSPGLEDLRLFLCGTLHGRDVLPILTSCPRLRRLTFHTFDSDGPHALAGPVSFLGPIEAPNLRILDVQLALGDIVHVLGKFKPGVVLPEITASIYNGHDEEDMEDLCNAMLHGLGALSSFEVQDSQCIVLRDTRERIRTMRVWNDDSCWDIEAFWRHLSAKYSLHTSVQHVRIATTYWNELSEALQEFPIQTTHSVQFQILTDWEDVNFFRRGETREMRDIAVPGLDCVELACRDGTSLPPLVAVNVLQCFRLKEGRTIKVAVVIDGAVPKGTASDIWKESMASCLKQEGFGRWNLMFE